MNKSIGSERSLCWYVRAAAVAVTVIGFVCFLLARHEHMASGGANSLQLISVAVLTVVGILIQAVSLVPKFWGLKYLPLVCYLANCVLFLNAEMVFISQVLIAIDELSFPPAWIGAVVCWFITVVLTITSMVMYERRRSVRLANS